MRMRSWVPGEQKVDMPDGPARMSRALDAPKNLQGANTFDMGTRGIFLQGIDEQAQTVRIDGKGVTMGGFADMLTQVMQMSGGGSRPVVDQTGLAGHYEVELNLLGGGSGGSGSKCKWPAGFAGS